MQNRHSEPSHISARHAFLRLLRLRGSVPFCWVVSDEKNPGKCKQEATMSHLFAKHDISLNILKTLVESYDQLIQEIQSTSPKSR
jgi:hypothetical protein